MARIFYPYESLGDVLLVLVDPEKKAAGILSRGEVTRIDDAEGNPIGYNLFNFSRKCKLRVEHGIVYSPLPEFLEIVVHEIKNAGFEPPHFEETSGYYVGEVTLIEEHPVLEKHSIVSIKTKDGELHTVSNLTGYKEGDKVVYLADGFIASDGTKFVVHTEKNIAIECLLCSEKELGIDSEISAKTAYVVRNREIGEDFFTR